MFGVPGQYQSVALVLTYKLDFSSGAKKDGFCKSNHIIIIIYIYIYIYIYVSRKKGSFYIIHSTL